MRRQLLPTLCLAILFLAGCAGKNADNENFDMRANLEPEVWDISRFKDLKRGRPLTAKEMEALASQGDIGFDLDVQETEEVEMFFRYFAVDHRDTMERWLERSAKHLPYVRAVLASYNLPPDLIVLPFIESGYNTMAYSPAGAGGMWQFMPATGRDFDLRVDWWMDERRNPYKSTVAAAQYLTKLHGMFGDWNLALAAYNAGEGKVSRAMAASGQTDFFNLAKNPKLLKQETRHYVPKFLAVLKIFKNLEALGFKSVDWQAGQIMKELAVPGGTDLRAMAEACGMTWEQFHEKNSFFRRQVSPPDRSVTAYLPQNKIELAQGYLRSPDSRPAAGYVVYAAQAGETWWQVSRRAGVPVAALRECNPSLGDALAAGASIKIPQHCSPNEAGGRMLASIDGGDAGTVSHAVRKGDTLAKLARKYGVSPQAIVKANSLKRGRNLALGQRLVIPGADPSPPSAPGAPSASSRAAALGPDAAHVIKKGDTLGAIAARYGVSSQELMRANNLTSPKKLVVGKKLVIPGAGVEVAAKPDKAKTLAAAAALRTQAAPAAPVRAAAPEPRTPSPTTVAEAGYVVQKGDTLYSIGKRFSLPHQTLLDANKLSDPSKLREGMRLSIPGLAAAPATRPAVERSTEAKPVIPAKTAMAKPAAEPKPMAAPAPAPFAQAKAAPAAPTAPAPKAVAQAAPAPAPKASAAKARSYTVAKGETVWGIAKKFQVQPESLMAWNNLKTAQALREGAQLRIQQE